jgi:WD40 repeat protein
MTTAMCIGFNADKSLGIVGSSNPQIETFALSERKKMRNLQSVKITNSGVNQFSFRNDNKVCILKMHVLLFLHEGLTFLNLQLLASAGWDSCVRVFAVRGADSKVPLRPLAVLPSYTSEKSLTCALFSPKPVNNLNNKFILAAGGEGCTVCLWDIYN